MTIAPRGLFLVPSLLIVAAACILPVHAEEGAGVNMLPDAPLPQMGRVSNDVKDDANSTGGQKPARGGRIAQRLLNTVDPGYLHVGDKWDVTINKGEVVRPFTKVDKLHYAWEEEWSPFTLFDAAWSAGYEHLRDGVPHFGSDKAGYGERLGAAAFRQGTYKLFGDGVFPALLQEDPRYYRVAEGSFWFRATRSARQVVWNHRDNGTRGIAYSTLLGEVVSNTLPLTFYPENSVSARSTLVGIGISLADDAAVKLFREFIPDVFQAAGLVPRR